LHNRLPIDPPILTDLCLLVCFFLLACLFFLSFFLSIHHPGCPFSLPSPWLRVFLPTPTLPTLHNRLLIDPPILTDMCLLVFSFLLACLFFLSCLFSLPSPWLPVLTPTLPTLHNRLQIDPPIITDMCLLVFSFLLACLFLTLSFFYLSITLAARILSRPPQVPP
jgi:preprotein translocase subunit Sec61beta